MPLNFTPTEPEPPHHPFDLSQTRPGDKQLITPLPEPPAPPQPTRVIVTEIQIPFGQLVWLCFKIILAIVIASLPFYCIIGLANSAP